MRFSGGGDWEFLEGQVLVEERRIEEEEEEERGKARMKLTFEERERR